MKGFISSSCGISALALASVALAAPAPRDELVAPTDLLYSDVTWPATGSDPKMSCMVEFGGQGYVENKSKERNSCVFAQWFEVPFPTTATFMGSIMPGEQAEVSVECGIVGPGAKGDLISFTHDIKHGDLKWNQITEPLEFKKAGEYAMACKVISRPGSDVVVQKFNIFVYPPTKKGRCGCSGKAAKASKSVPEKNKKKATANARIFSATGGGLNGAQSSITTTTTTTPTWVGPTTTTAVLEYASIDDLAAGSAAARQIPPLDSTTTTRIAACPSSTTSSGISSSSATTTPISTSCSSPSTSVIPTTSSTTSATSSSTSSRTTTTTGSTTSPSSSTTATTLSTSSSVTSSSQTSSSQTTSCPTTTSKTTSSQTSSSQTSSSQTSSSQTTTSKTTSSQTSTCQTTTSKTTSSQSSSSQTTSCPTTSSKTTSSQTTSSQTTTTTQCPPASTDVEFYYKACVNSIQNGERIFPHNPITSPNMTPAICAAHCYEFPYFGVEYSSECWCGDKIANAILADESECSLPCKGDPSQTCGGNYRMSVYSQNTPCRGVIAPQPSPGPQPNINSTLQGCYTETSEVQGTPRLLAEKTLWSDNLTLEQCEAFCDEQGKARNPGSSAAFRFWGVEYGSECYCADKMTPGWTKVPDTDCRQQCSGNADEGCGGPNRVRVYTPNDFLQ